MHCNEEKRKRTTPSPTDHWENFPRPSDFGGEKSKTVCVIVVVLADLVDSAGGCHFCDWWRCRCFPARIQAGG